jgi:enolase
MEQTRYATNVMEQMRYATNVYKVYLKLVKKHGKQLYTDSDDGWFNISLAGSNLR